MPPHIWESLNFLQEELLIKENDSKRNMNHQSAGVYLRRISISHNQENASHIRVRNPHLRAVDDKVFPIFLRHSLQGEGV